MDGLSFKIKTRLCNKNKERKIRLSCEEKAGDDNTKVDCTKSSSASVSIAIPEVEIPQERAGNAGITQEGGEERKRAQSVIITMPNGEDTKVIRKSASL